MSILGDGKIKVYGELPEGATGELDDPVTDEFYQDLENLIEMGLNAVAENVRMNYPNLNVEVETS